MLKVIGWLIFSGFVMIGGFFGQFLYRLDTGNKEPFGWNLLSGAAAFTMFILLIMLSIWSDKEVGKGPEK